MASALSPAKVLLLAVHHTANARIDDLKALIQRQEAILHEKLILRILLTHLPETVRPHLYVGLLKEISDMQFRDTYSDDVDLSPVSNLTEAEVLKRVKRFHLRSLNCSGSHSALQGDILGRFLVLRAHSMDAETGISSQILDLLLPFAHRNSHLYTWICTIVLPFIKKKQATDSWNIPGYSLLQFDTLPDTLASKYLLLQPTPDIQRHNCIEWDLKAVFGPWLYNPDRWKEASIIGETSSSSVTCDGLQEMMQWLVSQAFSSWSVAVQALENWNGLDDVEFGHELTMTLPKHYRDLFYLRYATATIACIYSVHETSLECLSSLFSIVAKLRFRLGHDEQCKSLEEALITLPNVSLSNLPAYWDNQTTNLMRSNIHGPDNILINPNADSTNFVLALTLSAYILTLYGVPSSVKRVRDLTLLHDTQEQRSEFSKLLRAIKNHKPVGDDEYLSRFRKHLLWLREWHNDTTISHQSTNGGTFGAVKIDFMDAEFLRLLLSEGHYELSRRLYEMTDNKPLPAEVVQEAVCSSALAAFDNATTANRAQGGLKKCDEILKTFPLIVGSSLAGVQRIQALLKATHALSGYRLVLKAGEPFCPVVLRVHSDPISIVGKVLEQNPGSYTRLQEFLDIGVNISQAGLPLRSSFLCTACITKEQAELNIGIAEIRITALCIQAALKEEDFETAYSYVANRLSNQSGNSSSRSSRNLLDQWSWKAALQAGQYIRTEQSKRPTHLGTASGNPEIRHLEQRIDCLATALRLAPTSQLQDILKSFRRCEEQLDSAIKEEAANEAYLNVAADASRHPGAFKDVSAEEHYTSRTVNSANTTARQTDDVPMSLFDLSRATARIAQRNFTAISGLQSSSGGTGSEESETDKQPHQRIRRRDQLREAATGTLVTGVGWLIGASASQSNS